MFQNGLGLTLIFPFLQAYNGCEQYMVAIADATQNGNTTGWSWKVKWFDFHASSSVPGNHESSPTDYAISYTSQAACAHGFICFPELPAQFWLIQDHTLTPKSETLYTHNRQVSCAALITDMHAWKTVRNCKIQRCENRLKSRRFGNAALITADKGSIVTFIVSFIARP